MVSDTVRVAVLVAVVAAGPVAAAAGAAAAGDAATAQENDQAIQESTCAATPPADLADPESDVLGWEGGVWYSETIPVNQSDGLNESELDATISRTQARVEFIRCLEFRRSVPVEVITRAQFRERQSNRRVPRALRAFDNAKFEALFLINESADSIAVQNRNRGTSVLGYYSPRNDTIVLISGGNESLRVDEVTLGHELVHALQDARWDLTSEEFGERLRDAANAVDGIVEGDAAYVDYVYGERCEDGAWAGTCLQATQATNRTLANVGVYFLKFQPYSDGPGFVRLAREVGGWDAVNRLYEQPPASTEQIIHPRRYSWDAPTNVTLDSTAEEPWTRVRPPGRPDYATVGEAGLVAMFVYPTYHSQGRTQIIPAPQFLNTNESGNVTEFDPLHYDANYSRGWDGDKLYAYRNDAGELAYVWRLAWDSPSDAREFVAGYARVLRYWGAERVGPRTWVIERGGFADAFHVTVQETTVTITNAPTVDALSAVRPSVNVTGVNATNASVGGPVR